MFYSFIMSCVLAFNSFVSADQETTKTPIMHTVENDDGEVVIQPIMHSESSAENNDEEVVIQEENEEQAVNA